MWPLYAHEPWSVKQQASHPVTLLSLSEGFTMERLPGYHFEFQCAVRGGGEYLHAPFVKSLDHKWMRMPEPIGIAATDYRRLWSCSLEQG